MYLIVRGLVLRVTKYNDKDALLTVLTQDQGKLTVKARGLYRKNSPLVAPCQLLAYSEFTLFEYRGLYTVNEAQTLCLFQGLRRDLTKLSLATYFSQVTDNLGQEDTMGSELLSLTLNCLYALENLNVSQKVVKAVFELRAACLAGYRPALYGCYRCGNPMPDRLNIAEGRLECVRCKDPDSTGLRMPILPGVLDCMRYISICDAKRIFSFQVGEDIAENLAQIAETYLTTQLEQGFSTLDFYKTLQLQQ